MISVPARILDELSSDDTTVHEGDNVVLVCNVTGVPRPTVRWLRRPFNSKAKGSEQERNKYKWPGKISSAFHTILCI